MFQFEIPVKTRLQVARDLTLPYGAHADAKLCPNIDEVPVRVHMDPLGALNEGD